MSARAAVARAQSSLGQSPVLDALAEIVSGLEALAASGAAASGGTEVITVLDTVTPYVLRPSGVSLIRNQTGGAVSNITLPDGIDGATKTIVLGVNGQDAQNEVAVKMSNNLGNDFYDFAGPSSVTLAWSTASLGWVAINYCSNPNLGWD